MDRARLDEVLARATQRDPEALDQLYTAYVHRVYGLILQSTGSREARDLTQETFLRMVRAIHKYRMEGSFKAWLFRIALNVVRDWRRKPANPVTFSELPDGAKAPFRGEREGEPSSERISRGQELERMRAALAQLREEERTALLLRHYAELPNSEIAEILGSNVNTVATWVHRGCKQLRRFMGTPDAD